MTIFIQKIHTNIKLRNVFLVLITPDIFFQKLLFSNCVWRTEVILCVTLSNVWYQNKVWFLTCIINLPWFGYEIKAQRLVWQQMASLGGGEPFRKQNLVERNSSLWAFSWEFALFHTSLFSATLFLLFALSLLWSEVPHFATLCLPLSSASSCVQKQQPLCA